LVMNETSTQAPSGCAHNSYSITRRWTATDAGGNSSSATQTITITPVPPVFTSFPDDVTVACAGDIPDCGAAAATNNCGGLVTVTCSDAIINQTCANRFTVVRTYTASDVCGNMTTSNQIITVNDTIAPVITAFPNDLTVSCPSLVPAPDTSPILASDNCSGPLTFALANETTSAQTCADHYTITRTYQVADACGNSTTRNQLITVDDHTAPVLSGVPADATVNCGSIPTPATPSALDNCGGAVNIVLAQQSAGLGSSSYAITRTWTATDGCGNSSSATQVLTVVDTLAPVLSGVPANSTVQCDAVPAASTPTASDSCDGAPVVTLAESSTQAASGCGHYNYTITRTWTATDAAGNSNSASQVITVKDTTAPVITAYPADATLDCMCDLPAANDAPITASDNCSAVTITHTADVTNNVVDARQFDIQRTYFATDTCGNSSSHTQTFHLDIPGPPFITINGAPSIRVSNSVYTVTGTAGNTVPLLGVHYSFNGAPYQLATGSSNWSVLLHLAPGTNTLTAYSVDNKSNVSTSALASIFYYVPGKLTVLVRDWPEAAQIDNAAGTITPNLGGQILEIGKNYTITAAGLTVHRFVGWSYSTSLSAPMFDTNATLTFMMQPGLTLVARFENPVYHLKGAWSGLFSEATPDSRSAGFISIVTPYKQPSEQVAYYSGRILLDGVTYSIKYPAGKFDTTGHSHLVLARGSDKSPLIIDLNVDVVTHGSTMTGTVVASDWTANLTAYRSFTNVGDATFRRYTMVLPPSSGPTPSPIGWGIASTTNGPRGTVTMLGYLADGAQIPAQSAGVSEGLSWPLYAQLYKGPNGFRGSLWGWLQFTKDQTGVSGTLYWWRPAGITNVGYTAGLSNIIEVVGSPYTNFLAGTPEIHWTTDGTAYLYDGVRVVVTNNVHIDNNNIVSVLNNVTHPNTNTLKLTITRANGMVSGSFLNPISHKSNTVRGVILQNEAVAAGFYANTNAGAFNLQSP
ncbi:MAG: HYR-like domain-containing protein, partial [Limisphaerales bacterium]